MSDFVGVTHKVNISNFYRMVLTIEERETLTNLCSCILTRNYKPYNQGLLIANIGIRKFSWKYKVPRSTVFNKIKKLNEIGVLLKLPRKYNGRYLVGFRSSNNDQLYLSHHLINKYDGWIEDNVIQNNKIGDRIPKIKDKSHYKLNINYRNFILDHIDRPHELINKPLIDGKTIYELLFNRTDVFRKSLLQRPLKVLKS